MARTDLRCAGDAELEKKLLAEWAVKRAIERSVNDKEPGARRQLLASAVRVTKGLSPRLDALVAECKAKLGVETLLETYVYPESSFNAACMKPESGRVFVLLSSALLEAFDDEELKFVVGHELGHHLFDHHRIPLGALLKEAESPTGPLAMQLFAWSRYAEISADRAGLECAGGLDPAARSFFKLASGLKGDRLQMNAGALLEQMGDIKAELERRVVDDAAPRADWFATHPFSPLRLKAAWAWAQKWDTGRLEAEVADLMSLMEPTYLEEKTEAAELMRRLLFAGGVLVAAAHGDISAEEKKSLERFFGAGSTEKVSVEAFKRDLERRERDVKERVPKLRRTQVMRDLCLIAQADGHVHADERRVLEDIAAHIEAEPGVVERTLSRPAELD